MFDGGKTIAVCERGWATGVVVESNAVDVLSCRRPQQLLRVLHQPAVKIMVPAPYANAGRVVEEKGTDVLRDDFDLSARQHQRGGVARVHGQRLVLHGDGMQRHAVCGVILNELQQISRIRVVILLLQPAALHGASLFHPRRRAPGRGKEQQLWAKCKSFSVTFQRWLVDLRLRAQRMTDAGKDKAFVGGN